MTSALFEVPGEVRSTALLSPDGLYRYRLTRIWDAALGMVVWVMLNPSTADASIDDRTIARCMAFARAWGFGGILVVNLYALRSTDPTGLWLVPDPVGPDNDFHLKAVARDAGEHGWPIVAGWGAEEKAQRRAQLVRNLAGFERLTCLHVNKDGSPKHPLYVRGDAPRQPWPVAA